jgi:hypothetical protein
MSSASISWFKRHLPCCSGSIDGHNRQPFCPQAQGARIDMPQSTFFYHGNRRIGPRRCGAAAAEMILVNETFVKEGRVLQQKVECGGNRVMGAQHHHSQKPRPHRPAKVLLYVGEPEGRRRRRSSARPAGLRRRRCMAALVGGMIGWVIAGLEGFAGTVEVPVATADFVARGTVSSPELGVGVFDLASNGRLVRQVLVIAESRDEMLFDRSAAKVTLIDGHDVIEIPLGPSMTSLLEPFDRARRVADGPLEIQLDGSASHLGIPCNLYRATGQADGQPLYASACITLDGIPLVTEILGANLTIRTQITTLDRDASEPNHFLLSTSQAAVELPDG